MSSDFVTYLFNQVGDKKIKKSLSIKNNYGLNRLESKDNDISTNNNTNYSNFSIKKTGLKTIQVLLIIYKSLLKALI